jgi:hypothetical protein
VTIQEQVDARKVRFDQTAALQLLQGMSKLLVAKGNSTVCIDLRKERPADAALTALMMGPTGNLRAPTMKVGKTLVVGFSEAMYADVFG